MKRLLLSIASVLCLSLANAQVPGTFSYQGILVDGTGAPVADGTHFVEFDFYSAITAGTQLYDGSANAVTTYKGMFTFIIGTGSGSNPVIPSTLWDNQVYLEVTADAVVLTPRVQLTSNPYAFKAQSANTVVDNAITSIKITDATIVAADIATGAVTSTGILDGTIAAGDLGTGSVTSAKIVDGDIVNADVNAAAAIAGTKIAPNFGAQNITTTGTVTGASFTGAGSGITGLTAANISGSVAVANGGTGATTLTGALVGNGTGAVTAVSGTGSQYFRRNAGNTAYEFAALPTDVTNVSGTLPISVATGTTTPVISISQATTSTNGYLSSTDWNTFNGKANVPGSQTANTIFAAPTGVPGVPSFRGLTPLDIPNLDAGKITTGLLPITRGGTDAADAATARVNLGLNLVPTSAGNGLTLSSNVVSLGGTLTGNTIIASGGNNLMFNGTGKLGLASPTPLSKLSVGGNVAIGNGYADNFAAPNNGLAVEGLVGIGITTPGDALDVASGGILISGASNNFLRFNANGVNIPTFTARSPGTKVVLYPLVGALDVDHAIGVSGGASWYSVPRATSTYHHRFFAGTTELMTIRGDGNVGIGTPTPTRAVLEQHGAVATTNAIFGGGSSGVSLMQNFPGVGFNWYQNAGAKAIGAGFGGYLYFDQTLGDFSLNTSTASTTANLALTAGANWTFKNNGNLGLGTSTPANKLDVEGGVVIGATYSGTNTAPLNGLLVQGNVGIGTTSTSYPLIVSNTAAATNTYVLHSYAGASSQNGIYVDMASASGTGTKSGINNNVYGTSGSASGIYGLENDIVPNGSGVAYGLSNNITSVGTGARYGVYNGLSLNAANTGNHYGVYNTLTNSAGGSTGGYYGVFNILNTTATAVTLPSGTRAGTYNYVNEAASTNQVFGDYAYVNHNGTGTTYGSYLNVNKAASQAGTLYGFYVDAGNDGTGSSYLIRGNSTGLTTGTEYGVYITGEDINYFNGKVGIGTSSPDSYGTGTNKVVILGTGYISGGAWATSDIRYKKDFVKLPETLNKIKKLDGVSFSWKTNENPEMGFPDGRHYGFKAQEVEKFFPELVATGKDGFKSMNYDGMTPVLLEAIKEQQTQIEALASTIEDLKSQLDQYKDLSAQVEELKKLMAGKDTGSSKSEVSGSNKK